MRRREVLTLLTGAAALRPSTARSQPTGKIPRVGFLGALSSSAYATQVAALLSGLRELGYIDGTNIRIEFLWAEGHYDLLPQLAAEFDRLKVDVLVTHGTPGTLAAKAASKTIPIVAVMGDPVITGVVTSIAQPGGNITGVAIFSPELAVKRLEILTQAFPLLKRVAVVFNPDNPIAEPILRAMVPAATSLRVDLHRLPIRGPNAFADALSSLVAENVEALVLVDDGMLIANAQEFGGTASARRLTSIGFLEFARRGGLLGYGVNFLGMFSRAAILVDRIIKGAKPGDLPIEQATKFEMVVNLRTAKGLGLTIPPALLARADEVIE
jgi:putative tryptophan/tyrosine transport system substrate-binding protein